MSHGVTLSRGALAAVVFMTLAWGFNWPMMKLSLREITPLFFRAMTMTGGVLLLISFARLRGVSLALTRPQLRAVAWLALPNMLGWHLLSILGVQALASGRAAILGFTMPIWTLLLGALFFGQPLTRRGMLSAAAATVAVGLLVAHELGDLAGRPVGIVWMQLAAVAWALGTLMMRRSHLTLSAEVLTIWMMAMSSIGFWFIAFAWEPMPSLSYSGAVVWSLLWGVVINYGIAQIVWVRLARTLPPQASTFAIMAVPLVGAVSAGFIIDEPLRGTDMVAAGFIMIAIASALWPAPTALKDTHA